MGLAYTSLLQSLDVIFEVKKRQMVGVGVFPLQSHAWVCPYNITLALEKVGRYVLGEVKERPLFAREN
jgi:hypothetical protein